MHTRKSLQRKKCLFYNHVDTKTQKRIQARLYKPLKLYGSFKRPSGLTLVFFQLICSLAFTSKYIKMYFVFLYQRNGIKTYITQI